MKRKKTLKKIDAPTFEPRPAKSYFIANSPFSHSGSHLVRQSSFTIDKQEMTLDIHITDWSIQAAPVVVTPCSEQAGPKVPLPHDPLGLFSLFFDDTLVSMIVHETNRYAEQCLSGTSKQWSTDAEEIRAYFGFMILMGWVSTSCRRSGTTGPQTSNFGTRPSRIE